MSESRRTFVERYGEDRIQAFESAAGKRLEEAEFLSTSGFNHAAVYLFGYVTELLLKTACFRYAGLGHSVPITKETRADIAKRAQAFGIPNVGAHDLLGWSRLLVAYRELNSPRADISINRSITERAESVAQIWAPQMRYRATAISRNDQEKVRVATDWFKRHYTQIIRK